MTWHGLGSKLVQMSTALCILLSVVWLINTKRLQHNTSISADGNIPISATCNSQVTSIFVPTGVQYTANISSSPYNPPNTCIGNMTIYDPIWPFIGSNVAGCGFVGGGRIDIGWKHPKIKIAGAQCKGSNQITKWHMWGDGSDDTNFDCSLISLYLAASFDANKKWDNKTSGAPFVAADPGGGELGTGPFTDGTPSDVDNLTNGEILISGLATAVTPEQGGGWHICNFDLNSSGPYEETATIMLDTN